MLFSNLDHDVEDIVPGLLLHHDIVGEHTAVPAHVLEGFGEIPLFVS